jgi:hypothetical protein
MVFVSEDRTEWNGIMEVQIKSREGKDLCHESVYERTKEKGMGMRSSSSAHAVQDLSRSVDFSLRMLKRNCIYIFSTKLITYSLGYQQRPLIDIQTKGLRVKVNRIIL